MQHSPNILLIQDLIAQDNLIDAIEKLVFIAREKPLGALNDIIIISRDLHSLKKATVKGIITWQEENIERRKLTSRMLELLERISSSDAVA